MSLTYDQPVPRRGGSYDPVTNGAIADSVLRRVGDNATPQKIEKAVMGALDAYVIIPRSFIPSPTLDAQEVWHADVDEHEERVDDGEDAEYHLRIARAHLALAGAKMDSDLLDKWRTLYSLQARWANSLSNGTLDYDEMNPETRLAVDELINAGLEP